MDGGRKKERERDFMMKTANTGRGQMERDVQERLGSDKSANSSPQRK